jgi:diacylglycerol kinase family enzyme
MAQLNCGRDIGMRLALLSARAVLPQSPSIVVLLNSAAGSIKAKTAIDTELRHLFHIAGRCAEIVQLDPDESTTEAARVASTRAAIVVAAGGDGTVSDVAEGIVDSQAALGVLPLGTRNHFAKDLRLPLGLREAVAVIAAGHVERVDVGRVNDRIFVNNSSIGIYPDIVQAREELRRQGYRKWTAMVMAIMRVLWRHRGVIVTIDTEGRARTWRTPFVFVGNNEYAIDGLRVGGRSRLNQGQLFVYLSPRTHTRDLPMLVAKALVGRAARSGAFEIVAANHLTIHTRRLTRRVAFDGEVERMHMPLQYRICPLALRVVVPRA